MDYITDLVPTKRLTVNRYLTENNNFINIIKNGLKANVKLFNIIAAAGVGKTYAAGKIQDLILKEFKEKKYAFCFAAPRKGIAVQTYQEVSKHYSDYLANQNSISTIDYQYDILDNSNLEQSTTLAKKSFMINSAIDIYLSAGTTKTHFTKEGKELPLTIGLESLKESFLIGTYERIATFAQNNPYPKILIFDESHCILSESTFRKKIMQLYIELINKGYFDCVVFLTASPIPTITDCLITFANQIGERLNIICEAQDNNTKNIYRILCKDKKGGIAAKSENLQKVDYAIKHHLSKCYQGHILIYCNDIKKLKSYQDKIKALYNLDSVVFSSEITNEQEEKKLLDKFAKIDPLKKVIFCTKYLIAGVNIKSEVNTIAFLTVPTDIELIQFSNRPRKNQNEFGQMVNNSLDILVFECKKDAAKKGGFAVNENISKYFSLLQQTQFYLSNSDNTVKEFAISRYITKNKEINKIAIASELHTEINKTASLVSKIKYIQTIDSKFILVKGSFELLINEDLEPLILEDKEAKKAHKAAFENLILSIEKGKLFALFLGLINGNTTDYITLRKDINTVLDNGFNSLPYSLYKVWLLIQEQDYFKNSYLNNLDENSFFKTFFESAKSLQDYTNTKDIFSTIHQYKNEFKALYSKLYSYLNLFNYSKNTTIQDCFNYVENFELEISSNLLTSKNIAKNIIQNFVTNKDFKSDLAFLVIQSIAAITAKKRANSKAGISKPFYTNIELKEMLYKCVKSSIEKYNTKVVHKIDAYKVESLTKDYENLKVLECFFNIEIERKRIEIKGKESRLNCYTFESSKHKNKDEILNELHKLVENWGAKSE